MIAELLFLQNYLGKTNRSDEEIIFSKVNKFLYAGLLLIENMRTISNGFLKCLDKMSACNMFFYIQFKFFSKHRHIALIEINKTYFFPGVFIVPLRKFFLE